MRKVIGFAGFVAILSISTGTVRAVPTAVSYWNDVAAQAVTSGRPGPPGLLDLALVQAAVHDAVQAIEGQFEPYFFSDPNAEGSTSAAVAAAAYGVLAGLYPSQQPGVNGLGRFKLIDAPRPELYDLEQDPFEEHNLYDTRPALAKAMSARLTTLGQARARSPQPEVRQNASPEVLARLAALGYVGSAVRTESPGSRLPDPKDCIRNPKTCQR